MLLSVLMQYFCLFNIYNFILATVRMKAAAGGLQQEQHRGFELRKKRKTLLPLSIHYADYMRRAWPPPFIIQLLLLPGVIS